MNNKRLPVVAAIPNYNMGESLPGLLSELAEQEYDEIYVLDDCSTDDSVEAAFDFDKSIQVVQGEENKGAGANRNRIMQALSRTAIIHFVDADMRIKSAENPQTIKIEYTKETAKIIGGLITETSGKQHLYNYGPRQCLRNDGWSAVQQVAYTLGEKNPKLETKIRSSKTFASLSEWPNPQEAPRRKRIFWAAEGNLVIPSTIFNALDGFDEKLRSHEIQDLAIRAERLQIPRYFNPEIHTEHQALQVRPNNRRFEMVRSEAYIAKKHGVKNWLQQPK